MNLLQRLRAKSAIESTSAMSAAHLVREYAARFHGALNDGRSLTSPLGAWLLLAALSREASGQTRARLDEVLGTDTADVAAALLAAPHPALSAAIAAWAAPSKVNERYHRWAAGAPEVLKRGPVPVKTDLDRFVEQATRGMIRNFSEEDLSGADCVLASILAAEVSWSSPYDTCSAHNLGGAFGAALETSLQGDGAICVTKSAGLVGYHARESRDGIRVVSVIGAEHESPSNVHSAALELLTDPQKHRVNPFELPLGPGPAWEVTEETGFNDAVVAFLPEWRADEPSLDIVDAPGVKEGLETLKSMLIDAADFRARQKTYAEYTRTGFRAAALTEIRGPLSARPSSLRKIRKVAIRFNRPYAVVAATVNTCNDGSRLIDLGVPAWDSVPIFSAWVTTPLRIEGNATPT